MMCRPFARRSTSQWRCYRPWSQPPSHSPRPAVSFDDAKVAYLGSAAVVRLVVKTAKGSIFFFAIDAPFSHATARLDETRVCPLMFGNLRFDALRQTQFRFRHVIGRASLNTSGIPKDYVRMSSVTRGLCCRRAIGLAVRWESSSMNSDNGRSDGSGNIVTRGVVTENPSSHLAVENSR
jgi:hypothetical protein